MASFRPNGLPVVRKAVNWGELVGYRQQHVFKDWDDVKQHANLRVDEVANLYGPGLADQINPATGKTYKESSGWQPIEPGDACWEDINGDNIINGYDRSVMGNIFPECHGWFLYYIRI